MKFHKIQSQIDAYRAGNLSAEEMDLLWVDLIEYPEQLEYLINSVNLEAIAAEEKQKSDRVTTLKHIRSTKENALFHFTRKWSRVAAVLLVGVGIFSTVFLWESDYVNEPKPIADIELDSYRSSTIPTAVFDYQLQRAINLASMEQFEEAIEKLQEIEAQNLSMDQKVSLHISKGSVFYNNGDFISAKSVFHEILDKYDNLHVLTEEQIHWFLGNTYLQLGDQELAHVYIQKTYDLNGAYRRLAGRYLN